MQVDVLFKYFLVLVNLVDYILLIFYLLLSCLILWLPVVIGDLVHAHGSIADSNGVVAEETFILLILKPLFAILLPAAVRG